MYCTLCMLLNNYSTLTDAWKTYVTKAYTYDASIIAKYYYVVRILFEDSYSITGVTHVCAKFGKVASV